MKDIYRDRVSKNVLIIIAVLVFVMGGISAVYGDELVVHKDMYNGDGIDIGRLTKGETNTHWSIDLFNTPTSCAMIYKQIPGNNEHILFVVDNRWHRIVYGSKSGEWMKSWGRFGPIDKRMMYPTAICAASGVEDSAWIFVIDKSTRINRLKYDYGTELLAYDDSLTVDVDTRRRRTALCIHDNFTPSNPYDDYLWVVDPYRCVIVKYTAMSGQGEVDQRNIPHGTGTSEVFCLGQIVCGRDMVTGTNNNDLYLIDPCLNKLVRMIDNGTSLQYVEDYVFDNSYEINDLSVDRYGQVFVLDEKGNRVTRGDVDPALVVVGL